MRETDNICEVSVSGVDWIGMIFYHKSPRYIGEDNISLYNEIRYQGRRIKKVGVFVNATLEEMMDCATKYKLDFVQLHGSESPKVCCSLQRRGIGVIKALPVESAEDIKAADDYEGRVDYLLFDTKCSNYGGSGKIFDWTVLSSYKGKTPFLLSGGLTPECLNEVKAFSHPMLAGIDINSGFEISLALKDAGLITHFIENIKNNKI